MKYPNDIVAEIKKANRKSESLVFFMDKEHKIGFMCEDDLASGCIISLAELIDKDLIEDSYFFKKYK